MSGIPAFQRLERNGYVLVVDAELQAQVLELDLGTLTHPECAGEGAEVGHEGRSRTWILQLPKHSMRLHLRPVRHGGWLAGLWGERLMGLGRPLSELRTTAALRARGAPVPRPVLVVGRRRGGFWSATLATAYEEGTMDGERFILRTPASRQLIRAARAAGRALREFHDAGGRHADLHIRNLLFREESSETQVVVVDLDRGRIRPHLHPARRMAELMRLFRSLEKRDLLHAERSRVSAAFFGAYLDHDRELRRAMLSCMRREGLRIALHRLGYRLRTSAAAASHESDNGAGFS